MPDVAGSTAGRGSVPSYPAVESAVRAMARVVEYAVWLRTPDGEPADPSEVDVDAARAVVSDAIRRGTAGPPAGHDPDGVLLDQDQVRRVLAAYGIELWESTAVRTLRQAQAAGRRLCWDVVLKATAEGTRERPDLAHVWRNIDSSAEMRAAWESLHASVLDPDSADFVVQKNASPGVPVAIRSLEDPLFGPVVSFGISGPVIDLLHDRAYRIPPLGQRDVAAMVREVKAAPLLFGYRGSAPVDVEALERLVGRVAQLQNDLPEVRSLDLSLVLVGGEGTTVLTASARVASVSDPRVDSFARRMTTPPGDTLPG